MTSLPESHELLRTPLWGGERGGKAGRQVSSVGIGESFANDGKRAALLADLMNEPRSACNTSDKNVSCTPTAAEWIQEWIVDISKYVKEVDPNHMVTGTACSALSKPLFLEPSLLSLTDLLFSTG